MSKNYYVYLLIATSGTTYVGATVNLERRLRQHNKELVGGAKATTAKVKKEFVMFITFQHGKQHYNLNGDGKD